MKLEAANTEVANEPPRLAGARLALGRIDAGERDQHVAVRGGLLRDFLVRIAAVTGLALGIDRKDHRADLALAIVARGLFDGGAIVRLIEIDRHRGLKLVVAVVGMRAARFLRMRMDIDGHQLI